jgi:hypothetical protein
MYSTEVCSLVTGWTDTLSMLIEFERKNCDIHAQLGGRVLKKKELYWTH